MNINFLPWLLYFFPVHRRLASFGSLLEVGRRRPPGVLRDGRRLLQPGDPASRADITGPAPEAGEARERRQEQGSRRRGRTWSRWRRGWRWSRYRGVECSDTSVARRLSATENWSGG